MNQLFSFEGKFLSLEQIKKIKADRERPETILEKVPETLPVKEEATPEEKELTREEMKAILKEKGVEFPNNIKTEKLKELMK